MNKVNRYVSNLTKNLDYDKKTRDDLKTQFTDHINSLEEEYIENGCSETEAFKIAVNTFNIDNKTKKVFCYSIWELNSVAKYAIYILFIIYFLIIIIHTISPATADAQSVLLTRMNGGYLHTIRIIPFSTYGFMTGYSIFDPAWLTILLFIPFGIFAPFILGNYLNTKYVCKVLGLFIILMQILKAILPLGLVCTDMAILQFIGCIIGYLLYKIVIFKVFKRTGLLRRNTEKI